ncbi:MAG: hybrid sensor histidine kinase/response regulator, partial [Deltaproteobacteria bacterium]
LGLAITRSIAEGHDGSLHVETALGRGAKFTIVLPLLSHRTTRLAPEGKRILVVEDEPYTAELLRRILEHNGHTVQIARDGREALAAVAEQTFDLVISDVSMPEMDGFSLFHALEAHHPDLASRFVFITADAVEPEVQRFLREHTLPCLTKPFSLEKLEVTLNRVIEGGQAAR